MVKNGTSAVVVCSPFVGGQPGASSLSALDPIRHFDRQRCEPLTPMRQVGAERPMICSRRRRASIVAKRGQAAVARCGMQRHAQSIMQTYDNNRAH